jgi:hypothetical protein
MFEEVYGGFSSSERFILKTLYEMELREASLMKSTGQKGRHSVQKKPEHRHFLKPDNYRNLTIEVRGIENESFSQNFKCQRFRLILSL